MNSSRSNRVAQWRASVNQNCLPSDSISALFCQSVKNDLIIFSKSKFSCFLLVLVLTNRFSKKSYENVHCCVMRKLDCFLSCVQGCQFEIFGLDQNFDNTPVCCDIEISLQLILNIRVHWKDHQNIHFFGQFHKREISYSTHSRYNSISYRYHE